MRNMKRSKQTINACHAVIEAIEGRMLFSAGPAGQLDAAFGIGGSSLFPINNGFTTGTVVAAEPNGNLLVVQETEVQSVQQNAVVTRLLPDGRVDTTYGNNGSVTLAGTARVILIDPVTDNTLFLGSVMESLTSSGAIDPNFNGGQGAIPVPEGVTGAVRDQDAVLVLTDNAPGIGSAIYAYNTDGTMDTSFGKQGIARLSNAPYSNSDAQAIAVDSAGRIDVSLGFVIPENQPGWFSFTVERLRSDGSVDTTFGSNGFSPLQSGGGDDTSSSALAIAPDGTIYQACNDDQGTSNNLGGIVAYTPSGSVEATMNEHSIGDYGAVFNMTVQPDGKVLATGYVDTRTNSGLNLFIARFEPVTSTSSGGPDLSFNGTGSFELSYTQPDGGSEYQENGDQGLSVVLQPSGDIIAAGISNEDAFANNSAVHEVTVTAVLPGEIGSTSAQLTGIAIGTTGSYRNHGTVGANAFDGNTSTFFDAPTASGSWTGLDFGSPKVINQIDYFPRQGFMSRMVGGVFQASNDPAFKSGVATLYTVTAVPINYDFTNVATGDPGSYRYVRYLGPAKSYCDIAEAQFFGSASSAPVLLTGSVIGTSGSYQNQGNTRAKVFDRNLSTFFDAPSATGSYAGLDLGTAQIISQISYAPRAGWASRMVGGVFEGSNSADFSSGNRTLYTVLTVPQAGVLTTVDVSNWSAFRYVRYVGPAGSYCNIAEAQFLGFTPVVGATVESDGTLLVDGTSGDDNIHVTLNIEGISNLNTVTINGILQTFTGVLSALVVNAGAGNDTVLLDGIDDITVTPITVNGGDGNDSVTTHINYGDSRFVRIYLDGGAGNDVLDVENDGFATLIGGDGNDLFKSNGNSEGVLAAVYGGDGNDTLVADDYTGYSIYDGGPGANTIDYYSDTYYPLIRTLDLKNGVLKNVNTAVVSGGIFAVICNDNGDTITYPSASTNDISVQGGAGDDTITVHGARSVTVNGGGGNDVINVRGNNLEQVDGGTGYNIAYTDPGATVTNVQLLYPNVSKLTGAIIGTIGSYRNHGTTISNVFNENFASYFDGPDATGDWVGVDLGSPKVITQVQYVPRFGFENRMVGGQIQASNSDTFSTGVVMLYTITSVPYPGLFNIQPFNNNTAFRYYRYISPSNSYGNIAELEFDG